MQKLQDDNKEKRKQRRKQTAECFTPLWLVDQMLDKLERYSSDTFTDVEKTYLDPACGNGNILIQVLKRKLKHAHPVQAISTIYGCDIQKDNIQECRLRLLKVITKHKTVKLTKQEYIEIIKKLAKNIVWTPLSKYPNGSLDYLGENNSMFAVFQESFPNYLSEKRCEETLDKIKEKKLLDGLTIE